MIWPLVAMATILQNGHRQIKTLQSSWSTKVNLQIYLLQQTTHAWLKIYRLIRLLLLTLVQDSIICIHG